MDIEITLKVNNGDELRLYATKQEDPKELLHDLLYSIKMTIVEQLLKDGEEKKAMSILNQSLKEGTPEYKTFLETYKKTYIK